MKIVKKKIIILIFVFCIFSSISIYSMNDPYVEIQKITSVKWENLIFSIGTIQSNQEINVSASVSGIIKAIDFKSGQTVKKDDLLITLENDDIQSIINIDKVKCEFSNRQYQRFKKLYKMHSISKSDLDDRYAKYLENKAQLDHDYALLNKTMIKAPFSGHVGIKEVQLGQYISAGQKIVTLSDYSKRYVDFYLPENEIKFIKVGENIHLGLSEKHSNHWIGKIVALDPSLDAATRMLHIRAEVIPPYQNLIPGMFIDVSILLPDEKDQIVVPQTAVVYSPEGEFVYLYHKRKVYLQKIQIHSHFGSNIIIANGLTLGDEIVISGTQKLFNGESVNLANAP